MRRLLPRLAALLLAVTGVSGCIAIKSESATTRLPGVVAINLTICAADRSTAQSTCFPSPTPGPDGVQMPPNTQEGDNGFDDGFPSTAVGQLLVGFQVPAGTAAPATFKDPNDKLFTENASFTADLDRDHPAPPGFEWHGYASTASTVVPGATLTSLSVEFGLPAGAGGAPFAGPFRWLAVVGSRPVNGDAGAPVDCDSPAQFPVPATAFFCYDSPPTPIGGAIGAGPNQAPRPVSDFRVMPGTGATAAPGQTATVSFPVRYTDGAGFGAQTLRLSATSGLPGGPAVTPASPTLAIAPGAAPSVSASVSVPAGTAPGTYPVTLSAADGATNPVVRTATATVTVVDRSAPVIRIGSPTDGERLTVGQRIAADYACTEEPNGSGVASCAGPVAPGAPIDTAAPGTKTFTVTTADRAGNAASLTRTYTVVAPPPPTINASVSFSFAGAHGGLRFTSLLVKDVPRGATVTASLRHGRRFRKRNAHGTVVLRPFLHRTLKRGTTLTVSVTKPGAIGRVRTLVIGRKRVTVTTTCLPPGAKRPQRCAT